MTQMKTYRKRVEPEKFGFVPEMIDERFDSPEPDPLVYMAVCHKILYDEVDYHLSGTRIHRAGEMMQNLSGDCQDHSVLLATLFKACGLNAYLLRVDVKTDSNSHILVEVENPLPSIQDTCDSLRRFYWNQFEIFAETIGYEQHHGDHWIVVDTAGDQNSGWSKYVGDISSHHGSCLEMTRKGDWDWGKLYSRIEV
jgi:hypothetical protein